MSYLRKSVNIQPDETILRTYRQFLLRLFWRFLLGIALMAGSVFLIYPLFRWGNLGIALFIFIFVVGLFFFLRTLAIWYFEALILTPKRIISVHQKGMLHREVVETSWDKIQEVSYKANGLFSTVFSCGDILITTMSATVLKAKNVRYPAVAQKFMTDYLNERSYLNDDSDAMSKISIRPGAVKNFLDEDVVSVLNSLSEGIGKDRFKKLLNKFLKNNEPGAD